MINIDRFLLYIHTLRYLQPAQVWCRLQRLIRRRWYQIIGIQAPAQISNHSFQGSCLYSSLAEIKCPGPWSESVADRCAQAEAVAELRFCFLNQCVSFKNQPDWHNEEFSHLWRFHLHYFDFLNDLMIWYAAENSNSAFEVFRSLTSSWIEQNRSFKGDGWHPFTISVRLVNWVNALSVFEWQLAADRSFYRLFLSSIFGQANFLSKDLEFDVRGNHILKNIRALLFIGLSFNGIRPRRWYRKALRLLEQELIEQILDDGGHFERNPGYHVSVFKDCLEIAIMLKRKEGHTPRWLDHALRRMIEYLISILSPNGQLPLLKDTTWDHEDLPIDLFNASALYFNEPTLKFCDHFGLYPFLLFGLSGWERFKKWPENRTAPGSMALKKSGYYVMRDDQNRDFLILDAGKPSPDYLPAHAHADMLSYELMVRGQRIIVDSGVYEYTAGPWRQYFRSTRAHNTVEIEGKDQSEVWNSFRMARRASPINVFWKEAEDYILVQGAHDGYLRLSASVIHRRTIVWKQGFYWLVVDLLQGKGRTKARSHIHLDPGLAFIADGKSIWKLKGCNLPLWITAFGQKDHSFAMGIKKPYFQGWYSRKFGEIQPNTVLSLHKDTHLPFCFGYVIAIHEPAHLQCYSGSEEQIEIIVNHLGTERYLQIGHSETTFLQ